jgi:hypothetical protein
MKKNCKDNTSRGYSGYHVCWRGKRHYVRSKLEYAVCCWLDFHKIFYNLEEYTYNVNGRMYKPDFFLYKGDKLYAVIEVKYSEEDRKTYISLFRDFFKGENISYRVFSKKHVNDLIKKYGIGEKIDDWINSESNMSTNFKGNRNPHYGVKHSDEAKQKIGIMTKKRLLNKEYREEWVKSIKKTMGDARIRQKISNFMKKRMADPNERLMISERNRRYEYIVESVEQCKVCGKDFYINSYFDKDDNLIGKKYKDGYSYIIGDFCSMRCAVIYSKGKKREKMKDEHMNILKDMMCKFGEVPKRKEFFEYCYKNGKNGDVRCSFGTFKELLKEANIG